MESGKQVLAKAAGTQSVQSGDSMKIKVDWCLVNDASAHHSIDLLGDQAEIFDRSKVAVVLDHDTPSGSEAVSVIQRKLINFARKHDIVFHQGEGVGYQLMLDHYVRSGQIVAGCGEHTAVFGAVGAIGIQVTPEKLAEVLKTGVLDFPMPETLKIALTGVLPSGVLSKDIILSILRKVGADSLTGKLIEFTGSALQALTLNDRITICNLAGRTGAVAAIMDLTAVASEAVEAAAYQFDLAEVQPMIVQPDNFNVILPVGQNKPEKVNEVFIGGCSGGRIEDLRIAAAIVRNRKVASGVRLMVAPVTAGVYVQALQEGLITDFIDAGAVVMNQGCSVCWGKSQGILDTEEVLVSAGSYNCKGWAGSPAAKIYITSSATAATSALTGVITAPKSVAGGR